MKIAIAQINPIIGDFKYNCHKIKEYAARAMDLDCDLVVFSELVISGYPPRDLLERKEFVDANIEHLNKLINSIKGIGLICGFSDYSLCKNGNPLYNSAALFENGKLLYKAHKRLLPTYDVFDERRYFQPWREHSIFLYKGSRIGLTICEDIWNDSSLIQKRFYQKDPVAILVEQGADLIINISASPFVISKKELRWNLLSSIASKYKIPLIYANQTGGNDSLIFDGSSAAFDKYGQMAARAGDFTEDLVVFDLDSQNDAESYRDNIHPVSSSDEESVLKALVSGTRDYVSKCGFSQAVIGLSGGIDSALTAYVAVKALGRQNVSLIFMPSEYTSKDNYEDTEELAANLGIKQKIIPINGMFKEFLKYISPDFDKNNPDVTEQNLQARIRGTILMGLSNKHGSILLTTGNKSECGLGYCTLYGDMNGGLAVISDVPKTMVYDIAKFINRDKEHIPARIIDKAPSAELKDSQTDQDDLPPYEIIDPVLKGYIEDLKSADELVKSGFDRKIVEKIIKKVTLSEYKRQQAAPGLKITSKAFGYGRRYPIAQKYYETGVKA
ncbi:NAD+ synthase (glutamine-hydrolyzing) [Desulfosarcina sp. BuS5]|uniref:NAD+ synthase n=1 Tax=Desulfosarcina sp. BuS5 TaxID=933262 RepID=UPI00047FA891|nr:NAD+ synthase [Desulfosarcina sp. BuS5]WDN89668.1 NAD+ synthase (glutamine-hydrolyzing) [Desulfosarcina sp. BuS5]